MGNIGIGTTNPGAKLEVSGVDIRIDIGNHLEFGGVSYRALAKTSEAPDDILVVGPGTGFEQIRFQTGRSTKVTIHDGNLYIGTMKPAKPDRATSTTNLGNPKPQKSQIPIPKPQNHPKTQSKTPNQKTLKKSTLSSKTPQTSFDVLRAKSI